MVTDMKKIELFTDGSCLGNPGPGGYGALLRYKQHEKKLSAGFKLTDSQYVRQGITSWIHGWKKRDWKTATKEPVKNVDLWKQLDELSQTHKIEWHWVKGHSGHRENEICDELARVAAEGKDLTIDTGYVK